MLESISRREFLRISGIGGAGLAISVFGDQSSSLLDKIKKYNVKLRSDFTNGELRDIADVLDLYKNALGDIRGYDFSIGKYRRSKDPRLLRAQADTESPVYEPCEAMRGYLNRGHTSSDAPYEVFVAPKKAIDVKDKWNHENEAMPKGEEKRRRDFKWILIHELAHSLAYKEKSELADFRKRWYDLEGQISKNCAKPSGNIRPEGLPTLYSSRKFSGWDERFADSVAYYLSGCDYANHDRWLMKRLNLIRNEFEKIKGRNLNQKTP